ncbi:SRPBCC family protein [Cryobacterium melibiosiphilum]|uniref:SRPBCC family protein n=1 Tax=Cryobacterium melibiosiphilum TaxID=995039 RepID=A0A3A5MVP6_9MICO|nr:SRPBCC family protein [Cryobacterium melibiosiphilum]RJT91343.1 SRPBCC family protein [Cryobacterium melibiosiphilum]
MPLNATRHISLAIQRSPRDVYAFASNPENLPLWAAGVSESIAIIDGVWTTQSPMGAVTIEFTPQNDFGILDHYVTLPTGETFANPLRVIANGEGSEVIFTLFRLPDVDDTAFEADAAAIATDLAALKAHFAE